MCGCNKNKVVQPVAQPAQNRAVANRVARQAANRSRNASIVDLAYHGRTPHQDVAGVPTGARYVVRGGIVTVFEADVETLISKKSEDGIALFSLPSERVPR